MLAVDEFMTTYRERVDVFLKKHLSNQKNPLFLAMRYSTLAGGKRFRPLLVYATAMTLNSELDCDAVDPIAVSVELIHQYSLIHDDLPCMDDDDLRHGKPSCHKVFGDAIAVLTGDALQSLAYELLASNAYLSADVSLQLVSQLARASGAQGMVLGQALDMSPETIDGPGMLENVHAHKTGALLEASVSMGAIAAGCSDPKILNGLKHYAQAVGLAYQIQDDILDLEKATEQLGKPAGSDVRNEKNTFPVMVGMDKTKDQVKTYYEQAMAHLAGIKLEESYLAELTQHMFHRQH